MIEKLGPFELGRVHCVDCLEAMKELPDGGVNAVITDPPYAVNAAKWDDALPSQAVLDQCLRISKGPVIWFGAAPMVLAYANYCPQPDRVLVWRVGFSMSHTAANGMFYKWHPILCWRLPKNQEVIHQDVIDRSTDMATDWYHPGTKPKALMCDLVSAFGGESVCDPYSGSGTTGVACVELGCKFIGFDNVQEYADLANERIEAARKGITLKEHRAGQTTLFDEGSNP